MKFQKGSRRRALEYEKDLVQYWKTNKTFEKSVEQRPADNAYVFYDGPPFITGVPHHGTLLSSIAKDVVPRYWTMKGKRVERVWGWDCHGLPAEVFTEKKLGIQDRRDIGTKISLEDYILTCRENMVATGSLWEDTIDRIGRWVDFKGAYRTMDKDYMESVWWAFKELYDKGKIYEGERVLMYCTRDATPLSKAEVTMDAGAYQDVTDPSVYVKFKLTGWDSIDGSMPYLLAWTTTPWTLPANTAIGVGADQPYVEVKLEDGTRLILHKDLAAKVLTDEKHQPLEYEVVRELKGSDLIGLEYEPLLGVDRGAEAHKVWNYPDLSAEEGTGIVHLAPAYGEEDFNLAKENKIPVVHVIDANGFYTESDWQGQNVWEANKPIAKELLERGVVWKIDYYRHSYPHCYRCGTRLMYRAHPSWFMDILDQKPKMLEENEHINWFPEHLKHGRFQKTIEQAPDWNLSRDRFWATAMPVWKGSNGEIKVVGSYKELEELSGLTLEDYHRPWVDDVTFDINGVRYTRIDKVLDCWFESGSMPFAQLHYPFENKVKFEKTYPGDFIVEYVGQVRAWFYYVHAVNTALFGSFAYKNVITTGIVSGNDGRKMSKSYGNFTDPNELMDQFSADSLRFLMMSSPLMNGEDFSLKEKEVADVARKLSMVWNMYDFFTLYASVDGWEWQGPTTFEPDRGMVMDLDSLTNPLDIWVVSKVNRLTEHIDEYMQKYDVPGAMKPILGFLDDASNWYVRRSRRRFWKSEDDNDKADAYRTLHYILLRLSVVMAPFTPFLSEELFRNLTGGEAGESVHLLDWPQGISQNMQAELAMDLVRNIITEGLAQRAKAGVKVRQPLASVSVLNDMGWVRPELIPIIEEELNVKRVILQEQPPASEARDKDILELWQDRKDVPPEVQLDLHITAELKQEGLVREVIRQVQSARKEAGLDVEDRIQLTLVSHDSTLSQAIGRYAELISTETLAAGLNTQGGEAADGFTKEVTIETAGLAIALRRA